MLGRPDLLNPVLINTIGHTAGILLFGLIIVLISRDWRNFGVRQTRLSLLAAYLALGWNAGSLAALAAGGRSPVFISVVVIASFAILSVLPAVLLHVALRQQQPVLVAAGYIVSALAVALHGSELIFTSPALHRFALLMVVTGFAALVLTAMVRLALEQRKETGPDNPRAQTPWIPLAALLLFTTSFLHFGYDHVLGSPWTAEIAWHHLGIPVALIVLLQDYRFLLLDTFIRFVINSGLAALYAAALLVLVERVRLSRTEHTDLFIAGLALVAFCLSLILFAHLKSVVQGWVSRNLFLRRNSDEYLSRIAAVASTAQSEEELLSAAASEVASFFRAADFEVSDQAVSADATGQTPGASEPAVESGIRRPFRAEAKTVLRFVRGDARVLYLGSRQGGRRYLSEDLQALRQLAAAIVEEVERFRSEELKLLASQAELRALQAQINPHFLFNALNTLYGTIDRQSSEARRLVLNLAEVFRYLLGNGHTIIELSEELRIIQAYLEIEALRLGDRLKTELLIEPAARSALIPILSIQPLIENAVKHGITTKSGGGCVRLLARKTPNGLLVSVEDTGPGFVQTTKRKEGSGMGLINVRRRLVLSYGASSDLKIESSSSGTKISFFVPDAAQERPRSSDSEVSLLAVHSPS